MIEQSQGVKGQGKTKIKAKKTYSSRQSIIYKQNPPSKLITMIHSGYLANSQDVEGSRSREVI